MKPEKPETRKGKQARSHWNENPSLKCDYFMRGEITLTGP